jgi:sarcosine oxidase subunit alpha
VTSQNPATSQNARLAAGGRIDRTISWRFSVDGEEFTGHPGDTLASALLANGRIAAGNSLYEDRPRGIMSAGVEESNALVRVEPRFPGHVAESMLPATTVTLVDGLKAEYLNGLGKLDPADDRAEYDKKYVHTDVLVIGGGPAGLAAAREAVRSGARVMLLDDQPELGGSLLSGSTAPELAVTIEGKPALEWVADVEAELVSGAESTVLNRTTAFGAYDANYVIAVQNRTDHLSSPAASGVSRQRIWHIRANQVVLAPGAHERPLVFENNDRPGIMLASAARSYLNRYAVAAGQRVVVSTTNDSAYALVADLRAAGVKVAAVVDARPQLTAVAAAAVEAGTRVLIGSAVANTSAGSDGRLDGVTVRSINDDGELTSGIEKIACDLLAVSGGWSPLVHLHSQRQGKLRWDEDLAAFVPSTVVPNQQTIGSGRGSFELQDCLAEGVSAGVTAAIAAGFSTGTSSPHRSPSRRPPPPPASCGWSRVRKGRRTTGTTTSWTSSATSPWLTCCAPPEPACGPWSTSSGTPPSAPPTTRARPPGSTRSASSPPRSGRPAKHPGASATSAPPPTAHRSPRWPSRPSPGASAASCSTPPGSPPSTRGTSPRAHCSRTWGSGSGPGTTRRPVRTWTQPSCASAPPSATRWALWTPLRWARSRSGARTPANS